MGGEGQDDPGGKGSSPASDADPTVPSPPDSAGRGRTDSAAPPATDYGFLADALAGADAAAFVHVGDRHDATLRYLTRSPPPHGEAAFVYAGGEAVLCPSAATGWGQAAGPSAFPGDRVRTDRAADPARERAVAALLARCPSDGDDRTVLAPRTLPHDAAVAVERAGYDLGATPAVAAARAAKSPAERDCLARAQRTATRGVARVRRVLRAAEVSGEELVWEGAPLSAERLRRQAAAALAVHGANDPRVVVLAGAGDDPVVGPGDPVVVAATPRGPAGYHGGLARTVVVGGDGGWERRAQVAATAALRAGAAALDPGVDVDAVAREVRAELGAYGFDPGGTDVVCHGVGLAPRERPESRSRGEADATPGAQGDSGSWNQVDAGAVPAGAVLRVGAAVWDPAHGVVRLDDLLAVEPDGVATLGGATHSLEP